ncbi:MAG: hypothetical protein J0M22_12140 [Gammaproteobacteria bacterium]|nr:hypothetical protein [Gammaproteobacteria bacterium]
MRLFLFLFVILSCSLFAAEPAKVVGVIPVKFNSKGMHAPLPYSQQMMQRGWASVPAIASPLSGGSPRYQPVRISKSNLVRNLSKLGQRFANMSPAGKALMVAYGAYEANCTSQLFTSLCFDGDELPDDPSQIDFTDFKPAKRHNYVTCSAYYPSDKLLGTFAGESFSECASNASGAISAAIELPPASKTVNYGGGITLTISNSFAPINQISLSSASIGTKVTSSSVQETCYANASTGWQPTCTTSPPSVSVTNIVGVVNLGESQEDYRCPPESDPSYTNGPIVLNGSQSCFKPSKRYQVNPADEAWLNEQIEKNPNLLANADIGLDDFVDWETGLPYPDLFNNPTFDPVSPSFADAAESIANGTVQHSNPNAPNYVPSEMMPNLLVQINNWHEGQTFVDVYTNQTITPEAPPKEETPIDWSKFPGITKSQYEASNNSWGNQAVQGQSVQTEVDKLTQEHQKLTDFIESPLPNFAGQPKLLDFVTLPTGGGCRGFNLSVSIRGEPKTITVDQHCPPYNDWGQPVVSWLLSIYTLLLCFRIFHRTLEVTP